MKTVKRSSCLYAGILCVICIMLPACSKHQSPVEAISETAQTQYANEIAAQTSTMEAAEYPPSISVPGVSFFNALFSRNKSLLDRGGPNIKLPAIWVFSPQGELARIVSDDADDQALESFAEDFASIAKDIAMMNCQEIDAAVTDAAGEPWGLGCGHEQWTALLLKSAAGCTQSCPRYESALSTARQAHPDVLQIKTLVLEL